MNLKKIIYEKNLYGQIYFELRMLINDKTESSQ